ncbi:MAG: hypothetical protein ABR540_18290 [Acidimicrobiales bacterium]
MDLRRFGTGRLPCVGTPADKRVHGSTPGPTARCGGDGSGAGFGLEGGSGHRWLAELYVRRERRSYSVLCAVGKQHVERLLDCVRFADGAP